MHANRVLASLLAMSALNLALMVPGGFVETRSFPGYSVAVLAGFNIFLTVLGLGSLILAYRVLRSGQRGLLPILAGVAFVLVYGLDLAKIFPVAAVPMSKTLASMEWLGTLLGLATAAVGCRVFLTADDQQTQKASLPLWLLISLGLAALVIVVFATLAAM